MSEHKPINFNFVSIAFLTLLIFQSSAMSMGWGFEVGRANETDVESLLADQLTLRESFRILHSMEANIFGKARQRALLGEIDAGETVQNLEKTTDKWWNDKIDGPIRRIVKNPAASCQEAREVADLLIARKRQKELLGLESEFDMTSEIFQDFRNRCHEEALDECNSTGRWEQFTNTYLIEQRQAALMGYTVDDKWVLPMLQECAIYELHYVSTTEVLDGIKLKSVIDGRIKLKPKIDKESVQGSLQNIEFEGEVGSAVNPFLQKLDCSIEAATIVCSPGGSPKKTAWASIKTLFLESKEFYVEKGVSKQRKVGKDHLAVEFSPAMIAGVARINMKDAPEMPIPFIEVGATGFSIAHQKFELSPLIFRFNVTKRAGYPVLFEFTVANTDKKDDIRASDSTVFQIIHKPEKKPFPPRESKPRKPLTPKKNGA